MNSNKLQIIDYFSLLINKIDIQAEDFLLTNKEYLSKEKAIK